MGQPSKSMESDGRRKDDPIAEYAKARPASFAGVCDVLRGLIDATLPDAASRIWHGSPVWFIGENPVVGYSASKKSVNLLFWNGRAFADPALRPVGKYAAAQAEFGHPEEVDQEQVRTWLKRAASDVFDSRGFFKSLREAK